MMAQNQVAKLKNPSFGLNPRARPRKPPRIAPTIPISMVTRMPPGSLPGMMALAIAPAIRPSRIHEMIHMIQLLPLRYEVFVHAPTAPQHDLDLAARYG